jgi:hypothetical protein
LETEGKEKDMLTFDIETLDFFDDPHIKALPRKEQIQAIRWGVAVLGTATYWHDVPGDLDHLWRDILTSGGIVGWNVLAFDLEILKAEMARIGYNDPSLDLAPLLVIDLFDRIRQHTGRWYKLDHIAQANLGQGKIGDGAAAKDWLRSGDPLLRQRAVDYCADDCRLTYELYRLAQTGGLLLPPRPTAKYPEHETLRLWLSADGSHWRLRNEDTGADFTEAWT